MGFASQGWHGYGGNSEIAAAQAQLGHTTTAMTAHYVRNREASS
jgi:integrase